LVDLDHIKAEDWNLNIRRYVDNTPEPEPEDVRAHLFGGVPKAEVAAKQPLFDKFGFDPMHVFQNRGAEYFDFRAEVTDRNAIRRILEEDANVQHAVAEINAHLATWWQTAQFDFATLAKMADKAATLTTEGQEVRESISMYLAMPKVGSLPDVRHDLLSTLKEQLLPLGMLDEFQVAGVFVNWWEGIKYDLKTITQNGWSPTLIPDRYLIEAFFQLEQATIDKAELLIAELEAALEEQMEEAIELLVLEPDVDEDGKEKKITLKQVRASLKEESADMAEYKTRWKALGDLEVTIKAARQNLASERERLRFKTELKKFGRDDAVAESEADLETACQLLAEATEAKKVKGLEKDIATLKKRIASIDASLAEIGGPITDAEGRELILKKHHDLIKASVKSYTDRERHRVIDGLAQLATKYAVSLQDLNRNAVGADTAAEELLSALGYREARFAR
jgi:type I restriction enzyme M protein